MHTFSRTTAIGISSFRTTLCLTTFIHMAYIRIRIGIVILLLFGAPPYHHLHIRAPYTLFNSYLLLYRHRRRNGKGRGRMNTLYFWHPLACINKFLILSFGGNDWKERARRGGSVLRKKSCAT
ncbi:hypothetical protein B0H14DRAFT_2934304 [Mycena olivaceomarginata]|nr:hypothetical protein B0H14DRAFT_2934304 [Mycena olivaceomarginata]